MNNSKSLINEIMQSTLLSLASFIIFDLLTQDHSNYYSWIVSFLLTTIVLHYLRHHILFKNTANNIFLTY